MVGHLRLMVSPKKETVLHIFVIDGHLHKEFSQIFSLVTYQLLKYIYHHQKVIDELVQVMYHFPVVIYHQQAGGSGFSKNALQSFGIF